MSKKITSELLAIKAKLQDSLDASELFVDFQNTTPIKVVPTSSAILNALTGVGGFPRGRVTEVYGPEGTGKTTIAIDAAIQAQKASPDLAVLYLDYEHAFDPTYARRLGLSFHPEKFVFAQPDTFEQGQEILFNLLWDKEYEPKNLLSLIIIDSAAAMVPQAELEGDNRLGLHALKMSQLLKILTKAASKGVEPAVIFLNQTRTKIDLRNPYETGEDAAGGKALRFYSTIRLRMEKLIGDGKEGRSTDRGNTDQLFTSHRVRISAVKNKVAPPWLRGTLVFTFGTGINNVASVAELAKTRLNVQHGAGYYNFESPEPELSFSCRGEDNFIAALQSNPALLKRVEDRVLQSIREEQQRLFGTTPLLIEEADCEEKEIPHCTSEAELPSE